MVPRARDRAHHDEFHVNGEVLLPWTWRYRCSDSDEEARRCRGVKEEVSVSKTLSC
jgi:hypothetical protein